jgi:hypothetical protein
MEEKLPKQNLLLPATALKAPKRAGLKTAGREKI